MKIWLDDERPPPDQSWIHVTNYYDCIHLLNNQNVTEISLDHDLGQNKSGYDVAKFIEENANNNVPPPNKISVHSQNPVGKKYIQIAVNNAYKLYHQQQQMKQNENQKDQKDQKENQI